MNRRKGLTFAIGVILLVSLTLTFELMKPRTRILYQVEDLEMDFYPEYHLTTFELLESEKNPFLIIDIDLNRNQDFTEFVLQFQVYLFTVAEFESTFNITDYGSEYAVLGGWFSTEPPTFEAQLVSITGPFVFVFWINPEGSPSGWTADVTIYLQSTLF